MKNNLNNQRCSNCGEENPIYNLECNRCNAILRNRIVNIDLWSTIAQIIEHPVLTFQSIIIAENKNFVIFLSFLISIKFYLTVQLLSLSFGSETHISFKILLLEIIVIFITFSVSSLIIRFLLMQKKIASRFIDNFAIISYSYIPFVFSLIILTPLEIAVFGLTFFTFDPSPFMIKPTLAYLFVGLEVLMILWSIILLIISNFIQSGSKTFSTIIGVLLFLIHLTVAFYTISFFKIFSIL
jgi:hypothetical protein